MPATTVEKRARQRANRLLRKEAEASTAPLDVPPAQLAQNMFQPTLPSDTTAAENPAATTTTPAPWPTPAPATFTISYHPLSVTYPEPPDPSAKLPTDAVRITREDLTLMLRQSYLHGTEHGWKANIPLAQERLQAAYEQDMLKATADFGEHEKRIREQEFAHGFNTGREAGIRDEIEHRESTRVPEVDCGMQTEPIEHEPFPEIIPPTIVSSVSHPEYPIIPASFISIPVSDFLSSLFEPFETTTAVLSNPSVSAPDIEPPSTLPSSFLWSDEPSNIPVLLSLPRNSFSVPPVLTSFPSRDLSDLRTGSNPWRSLQHRKGRGRRRSTPFTSQRQRAPFNSYSYSNRPPLYIPKAPPSIHFQSPALPAPQPSIPPPLPPALDWDSDPRLSELSRVLRALGWASPGT